MSTRKIEPIKNSTIKFLFSPSNFPHKASSSYTIWRQRLKKIIIIKSASFRVIRERYFERAWSLASVWKRTYKGEESQPLSTIRGTNAGCPMPRARVAAIDERIQDSSRMPISSTWLAWKSKRCNPFKRVSRWATTLSLMSNWRKTSKRRKDRAPSWLSEGGIRFFFHKTTTENCYCCWRYFYRRFYHQFDSKLKNLRIRILQRNTFERANNNCSVIIFCET